MGRRDKSPVRRYHDRVAARYDESYGDAFWQWHDALTWDHIKPHLPPASRVPVLDLGCGTGKWAGRLLAAGYAVTCVDVSGAMIEQAREKLIPMQGGERAGFAQADLCDLSALPGEHFHLALALGDPIGCTASPPKALKEIRRLLVEGGLLIATFDNRLAAIDFYLERGDASAVEELIRTGKTHWLTKEQAERFEIHTYAPVQVRKLLEAAGFEVIDMVGKTVLPMRHYRALLEAPESRRAWARIEQSLWRDGSAMGRASHLQVVGRVRA